MCPVSCMPAERTTKINIPVLSKISINVTADMNIGETDILQPQNVTSMLLFV